MPFASVQREPILCYITDRRALPGDSADSAAPLGASIEAAARAGVDWIQIREKDLTAQALALLVRETVQRIAQLGVKPAGPRILVNDRLDVALAEGAGGVHLPENSFHVADARRLLSASRPGVAPLADFLVGVSTHSPAAASAAAQAGADYIIFGPVFPTPSKATYGPPQGLAQLAEVCRAVRIPVLAIGGITLENASSCAEAGAAGVAAIRLFQNATNLEDAVQRLRARLR